MHDLVLLRELSPTLKANLSLQECQEDECKSLIKAQYDSYLKCLNG